MNAFNQRFIDRTYTTGIICIGLALLFFSLPWLVSDNDSNSLGLFMINIGLTAFYLVYRFIERKRVVKESKIHHVFLFLILSFISAWALNREIELFDNSVDWFSALLVVLCTNYASAAFTEKSHPFLRHLNSFINGVGLITFSYLALYLFPMYIFGLFGGIVLGISLHVFVPLLFVIYGLVLQSRIAKQNSKHWISFLVGALAVSAVVAGYSYKWKQATQRINLAKEHFRYNESGLPEWLTTAQNIDTDLFTQKVLKSTGSYTTSGNTRNGEMFNIWREWKKQPRMHDPLVMIATFFNEEIYLSEDVQDKIMQINKDQRHEQEMQLWSGDNLQTDKVNTEVKLWPRCNIAYTEKTLVVANDNPKGSSASQRAEAIYTFYMPEGSVVTSLSLWVNGKEEKGVLTTKALADSSYRTIVGRERRDPSVVHWREGNTVAVRVFPIVAGETRMFKVGITSPMKRINGSLRYEDIYFKGPIARDADEELQVDFEQPVKDFTPSVSFISKGIQSYKREGKYVAGWTLDINDHGLAGCSFSFDGNEYSLSPYHKKISPAPLSSVYLDINQSWIEDEFEQVITAAGDKKVFVFDDKLTLLNAGNKTALWKKLHKQPFSFFPLFEMEERDAALLVTKNAPNHIGMGELEGSEFMSKLQWFLAQDGKINVFNLGDDLSPYLRTMKEYRTFRYDNGDVSSLIHHLQKSQFPDDIETDDRIVIHSTDMIIEKKPGATPNSGPDHVMRLFSYNHVMQKLGTGLFLDRPVQDSLVKEAQQAYVVTPVSSLVVLEKQEDYERFGVNDGDDASLKNASLNSKGAVPEPHEWALIGLVAIVMFYTMRKRKLQQVA